MYIPSSHKCLLHYLNTYFGNALTTSITLILMQKSKIAIIIYSYSLNMLLCECSRIIHCVTTNLY